MQSSGAETIAQQQHRFESNSDGYARFRPQYPQELMRLLAAAITDVPVETTSPVLDAGSGTGIFTRQIARYLPPEVPVIGIEPAVAMRRTALEQDQIDNVRYIDGTAEALPFEDGTVRSVLAATAAHWFNRPAFYAESTRVLCEGGLLGVIEYVRDTEHSPAAQALEDFLTTHGGPKAYTRPDYVAELGALDGFSPVEASYEDVTMALTPEDYAGLTLSSSHARPIVERDGIEATRSNLMDLAASLAKEDGTIAYRYRFQLFMIDKQ